MEKKSVGASELKVGSYIILEDAACKIASIQVSRPGKHGHSKMRIEGIGLVDGKKRVIVMPGHGNVDVPMIGKRNAQVLSVSGTVANVMDTETYETFDLAVPEELQGQCVEGCTIVYWQVLNDKIMKQIKQAE